MKSSSHPQCGLTLMELLIAMSIAALLAAPLGFAVLNALAAQSVAGDTNDVAQQARFALQRMEAAVRRTAPHTLAAKAAGTSADWFAPVAFCLAANSSLIETTPADTTCTSSSAPVIAAGVSVFSVQTFTAGAAASPVIEIQLSVTGASGQSIALTSHTRLGGGTL